MIFGKSKKYNIYLDTCFLTGWIKKFLESENIDELGSIRFLSRTKEDIKTFISLLTVAEMVKVVKHDKDFIKYRENYKLDLKKILGLIETIQNTVNFRIIEGQLPEQFIVTNNILKYVEIYPHMVDCMHIDLAISNNLIFITNEKRVGELKKIMSERNIMTFNQLLKQFKDD